MVAKPTDSRHQFKEVSMATPSTVARFANMARIKFADQQAARATAEAKARVRNARAHGYHGPLTREEASRATMLPVAMRKGMVR